MEDQPVGRNLRRIVTALTETATQVHQLKDGDDSRKILQTQLNDLISRIQKLDKDARLLEGIEVPVELVASLDSGTHPDVWFKGLLRELNNRQGEEQAKSSAIKSFHSELASHLGIQRKFGETVQVNETDDEVIID